MVFNIEVASCNNEIALQEVKKKKDRMSEDIYDEYPSLTLARESTDENIEPLKLGERIKDIRSKMGLTLEEASQRTGLARSTLSKIENEQISPTFQAMQKLASGLHIDMPQLFEPPKKKSRDRASWLYQAWRRKTAPYTNVWTWAFSNAIIEQKDDAIQKHRQSA